MATAMAIQLLPAFTGISRGRDTNIRMPQKLSFVPKFAGLNIRCARIGGVEIPSHKRIEFSLQYIHGIGRTCARQVLHDLGMENKLTRDLGEEELTKLRGEVNKYMIEGDLRRFNDRAIRRLIEIRCYRGRRHQAGLPCRGQRTKNNCRTLKGKRFAVAACPLPAYHGIQPVFLSIVDLFSAPPLRSNRAPDMSAEGPPPNFWGDMPEAEYYASQGVRNSQDYFKTPHGTLFTQTFIPVQEAPRLKGIVCMTHGYGSDTGWMFQKIAIAYARWGYAVFAADLLGHGRSEGIPCYMGDMDKIAAASLYFFKSMRDSEPYKGLPRYLFGESMGGAATLLMYFHDAEGWDGLIFSAPLFVMPEPMKPSWWRLTAYGLLFGLADTWAVMPDNKMVKKAIKDPEKLKIIASNPRRYTGKPRVGTMRELCRVCAFFQENFDKVSVPFLTCHGTSDEVTAPESSKALYERAKSPDKTLKLYDDMYHSLIQGEPDENCELVLNDMREWLDARAEKLLANRASS